jgi:hypothetical protein
MAGSMRFEDFSFGALQIDGVTYDYDVVIDRGELRKRKKTASKPFREACGHTPMSIEENIFLEGKRVSLSASTGA